MKKKSLVMVGPLPLVVFNFISPIILGLLLQAYWGESGAFIGEPFGNNDLTLYLLILCAVVAFAAHSIQMVLHKKHLEEHRKYLP